MPPQKYQSLQSHISFSLPHTQIALLSLHSGCTPHIKDAQAGGPILLMEDEGLDVATASVGTAIFLHHQLVFKTNESSRESHRSI